jgi:hypothetical protein
VAVAVQKNGTGTGPGTSPSPAQDKQKLQVVVNTVMNTWFLHVHFLTFTVLNPELT